MHFYVFISIQASQIYFSISGITVITERLVTMYYQALVLLIKKKSQGHSVNFHMVQILSIAPNVTL